MLVTGRGVDYNLDCRATLGAYVQATTDEIVTNDNTPRTHGCIALGSSGNRQGSLKCFDLSAPSVSYLNRTVRPWDFFNDPSRYDRTRLENKTF